MTDLMREYLGAGLYVEFNGFQFRLYTERDSGTHEVFLEPFMVTVFLDFAGHMMPQFFAEREKGK